MILKYYKESVGWDIFHENDNAMLIRSKLIIACNNVVKFNVVMFLDKCLKLTLLLSDDVIN